MRKSDFYQVTFKPLLRRAGLPEGIGFHALRHTCATLLLQAGGNVKAVSRRLGHRSIEITLNTYAHYMPEMEEEIVGLTSRIVKTAAVGQPMDSEADNGRRVYRRGLSIITYC